MQTAVLTSDKVRNNQSHTVGLTVRPSLHDTVTVFPSLRLRVGTEKIVLDRKPLGLASRFTKMNQQLAAHITGLAYLT